ncbi:unnamed protein product [Enterobius vermicularis]|uniref:Transmembrane protein n=1 Tax=Enterobius vermicularis TaxID=51028 RepID=A0A0N4VRC8_ENTVE|nr:unnamed protein product [Enterobius vermicularis]
MVLPQFNQEVKHKNGVHRVQRRYANSKRPQYVDNDASAPGSAKRKVSIRTREKKLSAVSATAAAAGAVSAGDSFAVTDMRLRGSRPMILSHDHQRQSKEVKLEVEKTTTVNGFFGSVSFLFFIVLSAVILFCTFSFVS